VRHAIAQCAEEIVGRQRLAARIDDVANGDDVAGVVLQTHDGLDEEGAKLVLRGVHVELGEMRNGKARVGLDEHRRALLRKRQADVLERGNTGERRVR
jgi:hypothetical protein